jgi:hypothetical protein
VRGGEVVVVRATATLLTPLEVEAGLVKIGDFGELSVGEAIGDGVFRMDFLPLFFIAFFLQNSNCIGIWKVGG